MSFSNDQLIRYSRNFVLSEIGIPGQRKLLDSKVLVIGAGAIGGVALMYLAAAGVGTIGISDYDEVDLTNLQRQIIHTTKSLGASKLESAKARILEINPDINVVLINEKITVDNVSETILNYDFILDCTDRFESKFLINDACVLGGKPYVHAGVVRFGGQVMTYVPDRGPCLRCILENVPSPEDIVTCEQAGVLGSVTGIIGSIQATEAIKYLVDAGELLTGRVLYVDGLGMRFKELSMPEANSECPVCGTHRTITSLNANRDEYEVKGC